MIPKTTLFNKDGSPKALTTGERKLLLQQMKEETYPRRSKPEDMPPRGKPTKDNPRGPILWPSKIPAPPSRPRKRARPSGRVANKDEGKSALEQLSALAGSSTFRTPQAGRTAKRGCGTDELNGALGYVEDELQQRMALAIAVHTVSEWSVIEDLAAPRLLAQLQGSHKTRRLVTGVRCHRARLILKEVFFDLAAQRIPRATKEAAKLLKMSQRDYRSLYRSTAAYLESEAYMGALLAIESRFLDVRRSQT